MAYSDYGGYAYRNGERVEGRSDAVLSPEGVRSTPGQWPGWSIEEARKGGSFHVLLGDGPIFVGLVKQTTVSAHRLSEAIALSLPERPIGYVHFEASTDVDGHDLRIVWTQEDNYYVYAKLTQPDGTVWTGWSGYGVGAGLEDGEYGFDSADRDATLVELFEAPAHD